MGLLQSLIGRVPLHQLVNKFEYPLAAGSPPAPQPVPEAGHKLPPKIQPIQKMPYRLPMNPDGSGGGFGPQALAPRFSAPQANTLGQSNGSQDLPSIHQGGAFNPGFNPVQGDNLNYQQAPQPATFNPLQQANYNPHRPGIFF